MLKSSLQGKAAEAANALRNISKTKKGKAIAVLCAVYIVALIISLLTLFYPVRYVIIRAAETLLVHRKLNFPHWDNLIFHCGIKGIKCLCLFVALNFLCAVSIFALYTALYTVYIALCTVKNNKKRIIEAIEHIRLLLPYTLNTAKKAAVSAAKRCGTQADKIMCKLKWTERGGGYLYASRLQYRYLSLFINGKGEM